MGNRIYDYGALEREFVTSAEDISIRELCRRHGIDEPSSVHAQAKRADSAGLNWYDKRDEYKQLQHQKLIDKVSDSRAAQAAKEVQVFGKAIDAIELAFDKLKEGLIDGSVKVKPSDLALLIDRMNVLFNRPSQITEGRNIGLSVSAEGTPAQLRAILELTSGVAGRDLGPATAGTTLPRAEAARTN